MGWGKYSGVFLGCSVGAGVIREGRYTLYFGEEGEEEGVGLSWVVMLCTVLAGVVGGETLYKVAWGCQEMAETDGRGFVGVIRGVPDTGEVV